MRCCLPLLSILAVVLLAALPGCVERDPDVVVVATNAKFPPMEYVDPVSGEAVGFAIDLMRAIEKEAGLTIEMRDTSFEDVIAGVQTGHYHVGISSISITEERKEKVLFSEPYLDAGLSIVVRADETEITGVEDLRGITRPDGSVREITIAVQRGTTGENMAREILGPELFDQRVNSLPDVDNAFLQLAATADAVINDDPVNRHVIATEGDYKIVGERLTSEQYALIFPKTPEGEALRETVNKALRALRENGTLNAQGQKWKITARPGD